MSNESSARRNWIKNAAIIFLVILLLLTFFSKTILDYSLPEVSAQYTQYATLSSSVKVSGTVKANASYNVVYEADAAESESGTVQSRKVVSVFVKEGDTVEKDAPILSLKGGASDQLTALRQQYDELKRKYDLALLDDTVGGLEASKTLEDAKKAISEAKEELADLKSEYTSLLGGVDITSIIEAAIDRLNAQKDALYDQKDALNDQLDVISEQRETIQESLGEVQGKAAEIEGKISAAESMIEEDILSKQTVAEKLAAAELEYTTLETAYNALQAEADNAKAYLDRITASSGDIGAANELTATIKSMEKQLDDLQKQYNRAYEDYRDSRRNMEDQIANLIYRYDKELDEYEKQKEAEREAEVARQYEEYLKSLEEKTESGEPGAEGEGIIAEPENPDPSSSMGDPVVSTAVKPEFPTAEVDSLNGQIDELDKSYSRQAEDYEDQIRELSDDIRSAKDKLAIIGLPEVDDVIDYAANYDLAEAQKNYDKAAASLAETAEKYAEAKVNVESLRKQNQAQGVVWEYEGELNTYKAQIENLEAQIKGLDAQTKNVNNQIKAKDKEITAKDKEIAAKEKELGKADVPKDPDEVEKQIKEQEKRIEDLESQFTITEATQNRTDTTTELEREDQKKELAELEEKIAAYADAPETTEVTAPIAGRIVSVNFVPGDTVTSGNTVASLEIADKGYVVEIPLAAEEARKIQVGAPCSITNSWWYSNVEASVTQVRSDPQSQGKNRIVVIEVKGDVYEGQSLKFSIGDKSQSYDCVLPNSAIRQDSDGDFVLTVESKKTPLGMRYTAKRVQIEILASDETQTAVSGLYGSEFVITNATSPITDKQQVRLADN